MDSSDDRVRAGHTYLLVIVCEVLVVTGLWLLGRIFS
jgi:hypothetical protein